MRVNRILAVLNKDPDTKDPDTEDSASAQSLLLQRAVELTRRFQASLTILNVCYDGALTYGALIPRSEIDRGRGAAIEHAREKTHELARHLTRTEDIPVAAEIRWDHDRSQSVLRAAADLKADLIVKERGDHSFLIGLFSNTDWELLRDSMIPVWFVSPDAEVDPAAGIVAAVDQALNEEDSAERLDLDDVAFESAKQLSDLFGSPLYVVHAYRVPQNLSGYAGYLPTLLPDIPVPTRAATLIDGDQDLRDRIAHRHAEAIRAFVDEHEIPLDDLIVTEGPVDAVLRVTAEQQGAGLIVMGAGSKGRLDRLLGQVSAEPTLAEARCDVLFVKADEQQHKNSAAADERELQTG